MTDIESVVIGAGVVGLATAASLATAGHEVIVLEREASIGQGVSARNSEVIHAGIYYPAGSLKAQLCVRGRDKLYHYCKERKIPHKRLGKLIVAGADNEIPALHNLQQRAIANGVTNIELISGDDAKAMQPGLQCTGALHSADTGIVDSHALMLSLYADIENHGGAIVCQSEVTSVDCNNFQFNISLADGTTVSSKHLINCAGLSAIPLANTFNHLPAVSIPDAKFAKGNYFRLAAKAPFTKLIYPAPVTGGLGIHLTIDLAGQKRFGPDVEWLPDTWLPDTGSPDTGLPDKRLPGSGSLDYKVEPARSDTFYAAIRRFWPDLPNNSLVADYAGIRPKAYRHEQTDVDFEISDKQHHGIDGLVNLYGIESPGLTSSLAIGDKVSQLLQT